MKSNLESLQPGVKSASYELVNLGFGDIANDSTADEETKRRYNEYLRLRAEVYKKYGYLAPEDVEADGTERDRDDERSQHFAVVKQQLGEETVVACVRLVHKTKKRPERLPVEEVFTGSFGQELSVGSVEVSRLASVISQEDAAMKKVVLEGLFLQMTSHVHKGELGPTYAILEKELIERLVGMCIPMTIKSSGREAYNTENFCVCINEKEMAQMLGGSVVMEQVALGAGDSRVISSQNNMSNE